jgi:hypothetical protein
MDNATNNDTFVGALEGLLKRRGISFPARQRRIRLVLFLVIILLISIVL